MDANGSSKPLPELVYERLLEAICAGRLEPGTRLRQETLAAELEVSRLPVGQALKRLETEGFVCSAARRGLMVAPLDIRFVRELYEFRAGIEQMAAGLAARNASAGTTPKGTEILRRGRTAIAAHDIPGLIASDMAFHQLIYELADNTLIRDAMASHWNHTRRVMQQILVDNRNQDQVWSDHEAILAAVCAGDVPAAERCAREHVQRAAAWFERGAWRRLGDPGAPPPARSGDAHSGGPQPG